LKKSSKKASEALSLECGKVEIFDLMGDLEDGDSASKAFRLYDKEYSTG
jgi:hypothetical protein